MSNTTAIEWAETTWNPVTGCSSVSEGCRNCYARRMARRLAGRWGYPGGDGFAVTYHEDKLEEPIRWRKPRRVFVCSMGDLFHDAVSDEYINGVVGAMLLSHAKSGSRFMLLTKRAERMKRYLLSLQEQSGEILPGVWIGVTAENQKAYDERVPLLLDIPAEVRFVSCEPLLGSITLGWSLPDWIITGGETGPGARTSSVYWFLRLSTQCSSRGVPFFFKKEGSAFAGLPPISYEARRECPGDTGGAE